MGKAKAFESKKAVYFQADSRWALNRRRKWTTGWVNTSQFELHHRTKDSMTVEFDLRYTARLCSTIGRFLAHTPAAAVRKRAFRAASSLRT